MSDIRDPSAFVAYESFFSEGALLDPLFEFLGLPMTDSVVTAHRELMLVHGYLDAERATKLSSLEKLHIMRNAYFDGYRRALQLAKS